MNLILALVIITTVNTATNGIVHDFLQSRTSAIPALESHKSANIILSQLKTDQLGPLSYDGFETPASDIGL